MARKFRRIVVTGDCLRPNPHGWWLGGINAQTEWLHRLLRPQLRLATGIDPEVLLLDTHKGIDAAGFYSDLGYFDAVKGWTAIYSDPAYLKAVAEIYRPHLQDAVCVGFELPEYQRNALRYLGVPYIDLWVHPVRFLDDLMLAAASSDLAAHRAIGRYSISEDQVWMAAGLRQATAVHLPRPDLTDGTLLIAGQTHFDKSQVWRGSFYDPTTHRNTVKAWANGYEGVALKPHPYDPNHGLIAMARELFPTARTADGSVYALLADERIAGIGAVNSSAATEAAYFGKRVHTLLPPVLRVGYRGAAQAGAYHSLMDSFLEPDFWRAALKPFVRATRWDGFRAAPKPNRLRIALNNFWGFNRIESDLVVRQYAPVAPPILAAKQAPVIGRPIPLGTGMLAQPGLALRQHDGFRLLGRGEPGMAVHGPYTDLPAGEYALSFTCRVTRRYRPHAELFECRIHGNHHQGPALPAFSVAADEPETDRPFRRSFAVSLPTDVRECEVLFIHPAAADVVIDGIELTATRFAGESAGTSLRAA